MSRLSVIALLSLFVIAGCTEIDKQAGEDLPRLLRIDGQLNDGNFGPALAECLNYVEQHPDSYKGWCTLGWIYQKLDQVEKATESFDKSLSINPQWDNAYVGKGAAYRKMGDNDNARKSYLEAVRILPENAEAFSSLLVLELLEGNDQKAVEYGERAWKLRKDYPSIPANLAVAYHYLGDTSKRDQYYKEAERLGYHRLEDIKDIFDGNVSLR